MNKDIKKALEHCINNECVDCPNKEELGSGNIVCRARLLPEILEYISDLQHRLEVAEKALEFACNKIEDIYKSYYVPAWFYGNDNKTIVERDMFEEYFKQRAKEMLENGRFES